MEELTLNKNIYSLDVIFAAAYSLMEKAYFLFDEDKNTNIIVQIEPKKNSNSIVQEFKQELLNYSAYKQNFEKTKDIRINILKRALLTQNENTTDTQQE